MKKLVFSTIGIVLFFAAYIVMTVPLIERNNRPNNVSMVGGGFSTADVAYYDYRPTLRDGRAANVWWGTKNGEWRRLEWYNGFQEAHGTVCVLRDSANPGSWFGIQRNSAEAVSLQRQYDAIKAEYERQSFFHRVPIWRVQEFH